MDELEKNRNFGPDAWRDVLIIAVLTAVVLFYFRRIVWTDRLIYGELDIRRHFYLFKQVSYHLMRHGEWPLWISYLYCGMPLLAASQVTPFYLPDLLFMLARVPIHTAFNWDILLHLVAAQVFSYLFFRRMLVRRIAAIFCSMWFWNFFFLNSIFTGDALNIRAMLLVPAVFYFTEAGLGKGGSPFNLLFGAIALSMQLLCGGLQFTFYTMVAVTAYALFLLAARRRRGDEVARPMLGFAAFLIVGVAISAVQLLPAWEYGRLSVRGTAFEWFRVWALKPYQLIDYLLPEFEGAGRGHGYFGMAAVVLAAYALPFWKTRKKYFFLLLGIVSVVYSFGGNTSISSLLAGLPIVRGFRGPFRAMIFFNLSAFVLAGGTLVNLLNSGKETRGRSGTVGFVIITIFLAGCLAAGALYSRDYPGFSPSKVAGSAALMVASVFATAGLAFSRRFKAPAAFALILLLVFDLAVRYGGFYSPAPLADVTAKDWTVQFMEDANIDESYRVAVYNTAHSNYFGLFGIDTATGHHPFPSSRYAAFLPSLKIPRIASLAGVEYRVLYARDGDNRFYNPPVEDSSQATIERLPLPPLPRAFLVYDYRVVRPEEVLDVMKQERFDPGRTVILEEPPAGPDIVPERFGVGSAIIARRSANEVSIETRSEYPALLVLTECFYPGWRATVDGAAVPVLKADFVFRAVPLSEGDHTVVFRFRPATFFIGSALSGIGVIALLIWAIILWKRKVP